MSNTPDRSSSDLKSTDPQILHPQPYPSVDKSSQDALEVPPPLPPGSNSLSRRQAQRRRPQRQAQDLGQRAREARPHQKRPRLRLQGAPVLHLRARRRRQRQRRHLPRRHRPRSDHRLASPGSLRHASSPSAPARHQLRRRGRGRDADVDGAGERCGGGHHHAHTGEDDYLPAWQCAFHAEHRVRQLHAHFGPELGRHRHHQPPERSVQPAGLHGRCRVRHGQRDQLRRQRAHRRDGSGPGLCRVQGQVRTGLSPELRMMMIMTVLYDRTK